MIDLSLQMRLATGLAVLAMAAGGHADEAAGPLKSVGWLHRTCLASSQAELAAGTDIQIVVPGQPQAIETAKVLGKADASSDCPQMLPGRSGTVDGAAASYFKVSEWKTDPEDIAIGLIGSEPPTVAAGVAKATVDGVSDVVFTQCATGEGLQFNAWAAGSPNKGEPLWEGYYGLDYDLEASCP